MIKLRDEKVYLFSGDTIVPAGEIENQCCIIDPSADYRERTMAYSILQAHNVSDDRNNLSIKFDAMASHDITYVGIIQTARASGLVEFPIPYALTNCHNSLCAVGGTINEDDHSFGLSAAKKYGGIYVPAHLAVIHQYMREMMTGCGKMILGSDSHTRYGALGTMAMGEGGPELVKQLLGRTYDIKYPEVCLVYLKGEAPHGVGPHDVALAIIGKVFRQGFVKNMVLEFAGPGVSGLSMDFRNGIDVMTTETACLSSIWTTDEKTREYFRIHGREEDYKELKPGNGALYDRLIEVDLSLVKPMIALPFHPSNTYTVREFIDNAPDILREIEKETAAMSGSLKFRLTDKVIDGNVHVDQGIIAGCAGGTYENILQAASILEGKSTGAGDFSLSVYPQSQPVYFALNNTSAINVLMNSGAVIKTAFCGPCFGAGDVPANNGLSIRHTTRNFQSREGSKPGDGQMAGVALMDARSIAATAARGGILTPADEVDYNEPAGDYTFNDTIYKNRVYNGFGAGDESAELKYGPNIKDWPEFDELFDNMLLQVASVIDDEVTTTDELIPSGETSSYRSNPMKLAEFTLSRKDPGYVGRAKAVLAMEKQRKNGELRLFQGISLGHTKIGSLIYANKPGDGSAREQAASCQKVLGGQANIAREYATKRYRSNLVNWGMLPFIVNQKPDITDGDYIFIEGIRSAIENGNESIIARNITNDTEFELLLPGLTEAERRIILDGCLINNYKNK
ncbi:MAG TPA: hydratase [Clostridia bacterium]|nr:hydratase [Clostridia bacterium]